MMWTAWLANKGMRRDSLALDGRKRKKWEDKTTSKLNKKGRRRKLGRLKLPIKKRGKRKSRGKEKTRLISNPRREAISMQPVLDIS
jgi:hypothetical protein